MNLKVVVISVFLIINHALFSQNYTLKSKTNLSDTVSETSGLLFLKGRLFTHNDSGNDPILYEIDTTSGCIKNIFPIKGAKNVDWEDLTADDTFVYIGDFGNNDGTRRDLCIYKIHQNRLLLNDTLLEANKIGFEFKNQISFVAQPYTTNFDVEAIASMGNELLIFTKNWGNNRCDIYSCSKKIGTYNVSKIDSFDSKCMVTGADFSASDSMLVLCGYTLNNPSVIFAKYTSDGKFNWVNQYRINLTTQKQVQMEGICFKNKWECFISNEKFSTPSILQSLSVDVTPKVSVFNNFESKLKIFPNPVSQFLNFSSDEMVLNVQILNASGIKVLNENCNSKHGKIELSNLPDGLYYMRVLGADGRLFLREICVNK